jgi:uncharacterized protein
MLRAQRFISILASGIVFVIAFFRPFPARGQATSGDVIGKVKSIDAEGMRLVVEDRTSGKEVVLAVTGQTSIQAGAIRKLGMERIKPGSLVEVRGASVATKIEVLGQLIGTVQSVSPMSKIIVLEDEATGKQTELKLSNHIQLVKKNQVSSNLVGLKVGSHVIIMPQGSDSSQIIVESEPGNILSEFLENFRHNLFKPLLLFFFLGFIVPILGVKFEFPYVIYQGLTIFLLIAIGWHGGEELASLKPRELASGWVHAGRLSHQLLHRLARLPGALGDDKDAADRPGDGGRVLRL